MSDLSSWAEWLAQTVAETVAGRRCRPRATYRVQFVPGSMTFRGAAGLASYLDELGVSHLYASPYLKTRAGSSHGYAIVDYAQLNPALGGEDDYRAMVAALHGRGMGQIVDVVPNHMSAAPAENAWWNDVLENGPSSPHAAYFDIDWRPVKEELRDKVLLPILGDQYGQVLERGELKLEFREGAFVLRYYESLLPLDPRTYRDDPDAPARCAEGGPAAGFGRRAGTGEHRHRAGAPAGAHRRRARQHRRTATREGGDQGPARALVERAAAVAEFIAAGVEEFNGTPDDPHSFDHLDKLLDAQVYRLSHWKAAADEINYRRFFDVNDLAAVCMEAPEVFAESHRLLFELLVRGDADGLRIDHIDGLYEPLEYLRRLQKEYLLALGKALYERATENAAR